MHIELLPHYSAITFIAPHYLWKISAVNFCFFSSKTGTPNNDFMALALPLCWRDQRAVIMRSKGEPQGNITYEGILMIYNTFTWTVTWLDDPQIPYLE